jgi:gliding motility-associated-like protein
LSPSLAGTSCAVKTFSDTIIVKDVPQVTLNTPDPICITSNFTPTFTANSCYDQSGFTYSWNFGNTGNPSTTNQQNPSVSFSQSGNKNYSLMVSNSCGGSTDNETITVNQNVTLDANAVSNSCEAGPINLSGTITGGATTGTWSSNIPFGDFNPNETTLNSIYTPPAGTTGSIELTLTSAAPNAPCPVVSETITINIANKPIAIAGPDTSICAGQNIQLSGQISGSASSAQWTTTGTGTLLSPSNLSTTYTPSSQDIQNGTVTFILTTDNPSGPCDSDRDTILITIKPLPIVTLNANVTICSPDTLDIEHQSSLAPEATNYFWNITNASGLTITPSTSGTITYPNSDLTALIINNDTIPRTFTYTVYAVTNGCQGPTNDTIITVHPLPQMIPQPDLNVCSGDTIPFINFVSQPYTLNYTWVNDNTNVGIPLNGTGNIGPNLIAGLNASDTIMFADIQVTPIFNGCPGPPDVFRVNVYPIPEVDSVAEYTICSGDTILPINWSSDVPGTTYSWTAVSSMSTSGFPPNGLGNTGLYTGVINNGSNLDTIAITVIPNVNGCQGPAYVYRIFVKPIPSVQVFADTICPDAAQATLTAIGTPGGGTYQWLNGPNAATYTIANPSDSSFYVVSYTVNNCINYDTNLVVYYDLPLLTVNNDSICQGQQGLLSATTTPAQAGTYSWNAGTPSASGQQISASPTGTTTYTVTYSHAFSGCELEASGIIYVDSIPTVTIGSPDTDLTICSNENIILTASSTIGNGTFQWSTGETTSTITLDTTLTSVIQVVYEKNNCFDTASITVNVNPAPILTITDISVCSGIDTVFTATGLPAGGTYTWQTNPAHGGNTHLVTNPLSSFSIPVSYVKDGCTALDTANLTITPTPVVTINTPTSIICLGDSVTLTAIPNPGQGGGLFTWNNAGSDNTASIIESPVTQTQYVVTYNLNGCSSTDTTLIQVNIPPTLSVNNDTICPGENALLQATINPNSGTILWEYQLATTNQIQPSPSVTTNYWVEYTVGVCTISDTATVVVKPVPVVAPLNSIFACGGTLFDNVNFNSSIVGSTFNWFHSTPAIGLTPTSGTGNITGWTAPANTTSQAIEATISGYATASGCKGDTTSFVASIYPTPTVSVTPNSQTICSGSDINAINWNVDVPGAIVTWNATTSSGTLTVNPQNGTGDIDSLTIVNTSTSVQTVTITANVAYENCPGNTITYTINVNPVPDLTLSANQTVCSGDSTVQTTFTSTSPNLTGFTWFLTNSSVPTEISGYVDSIGTGQIPIMELFNNLDTAYTLTYDVAAVSNACLGQSNTISFTINPLPNVDAGDSLVVCLGDNILLNATGASSLIWSNGITNGVPFATTTVGNFVYTVTGTNTATGCQNQDAVQVTVNASPSLSFVGPNAITVCAGGIANFQATGNPAGGSYSWNDPNLTTTGNLAVQVDTNTVGAATYTVNYNLLGCIATDSVTVTSLALPQVILSGDTICTGSSGTITSTITPNPIGGTYAWNPGNFNTADITINGLNVVGNAIDTNYTYTLTFTDAQGCVKSASADIVVFNYPQLIAPSVAICQGDTAFLSATANIPNGVFTWYLASNLSNAIGSGSSISIPNLATPSHQYAVIYEVNDCSDTAIVNVTVNPSPILQINELDFSVCASATSTITAQVSPPMEGTFIWSHNNSLDTNVVSISPQQTTEYSVIFISEDNCFSNSDSILVSVIQNPQANIVASDTSICAGDDVTLQATATGYNYQWSTTTETTQSITDTLITVGQYEYILTVSVNGCTTVDRDTVVITVNPIPSILTIVSSLDSLCLGDSITLMASVQPLGGLYAWNPGTISTDSSLHYVPTNIGWNNFTLNYELDGCSVDDSIAVFVNPLPLVNASGDAICAGDTAALSATANIVGGSFEWYSGSSQVGTGANLQVTPTDTTIYQLIYTSPAQCVNDSTQVTVYAFEVPVISGLSNQAICPNDTVNLVANVSIPGGNFSWTDQVNTFPGNPLIVSPDDTTLYTVQYEVNYGFGVTCSDTAQALINVFEAPIIQNMNFTICSGVQFNFAPSSTLSGNYIPFGTTYTWTFTNNPDVSGLVNNNTPSDSIVGQLVSASGAVETVTAIVTPQSTLAGGCVGNPFNVSFTINPEPTLTVNAPVVCDSGMVTLAAVGTPNGGTYAWLIDPVSESYTDTTQASIDVVTATTTPFSVFYTLGGCTVRLDSAIVEIQQPTLSVSPIDTMICAGQTAMFVASANPLNGNFVWSVATQPTVENILTVTPSLSTVTSDSTYSVVYSYASCPSDTVLVTLHINGLPNVSVIHDTICFGDMANLTAVVTPNTTSGTYAWSPNVGSTNQVSIPNLVVGANQVDSVHVFTVTYTDSVGCSNQADGLVTVYQNPSLTAQNVTICEGDTATLNATVNIPNGNFDWYNEGDFSASIGTGSSINLLNLSGTVNIYNLVYQVNGCSDTATVNVTVNPKPTISINGSDTLLFCPGAQPITLTTVVTPTGIGGTYLWLHDASNTSSSATITPSVSGVYQVQFTSLLGCQSDLDQVVVNLVGNPDATINVLPGDIVCSGTTITLTTVQNGALYSWTPNGNTQSITETVFSNGQLADTLTYSVIVTIPGCSEPAYDTINVIVNPIPLINTITASPDTLCFGESIILSGLVNPLGGTYTWNPGVVTNNDSLIYTPNNLGVNSYTLTYTANGCSASDSIFVFVNPTPLIQSLIGGGICSGDTANLSALIDPVGGVDTSNGIFEWFVNGNQIGQGQTLPVNPSDTTQYQFVYTTPGLYGCSSDTGIVDVRVFPVPIIQNLVSGNICPDSSFVLDATVNIPGGNFSWTDSIQGIGSSGIIYGNTNPLTISPQDTTLYTLIYGLTYDNGQVVCYDTAQALINVYQKPYIQDILDNICSGFPFFVNPAVFAGNIIPNGTTYEWFYTDNLNVINEANSSAPSPVISGAALTNNSTLSQDVTYTVTPTSGTSGNCPGNDFNVIITIISAPQISDKLDSICSGETPSIIASTADVIPSGTQYTWIVQTGSPNITGYTDNSLPASDFSSQQLINQTSSIDSIIYLVTPTTGNCLGDPFLFKVVIKPAPNLADAFDTICSGQPWVFNPGNIAAGDVVPTGSLFDWTVVPSTSVSNETSNLGAPVNSVSQLNPNLINNTNIDQTVVYNVVPSYLGCEGDTFNINLLVEPTPLIVGQNFTICSGTSFTHIPQNGPPNIVPTGTTYTWSVIGNNTHVTGWSNVTSSQDTISQTLTNDTTIQQQIVYQITPFSGNCQGLPFYDTVWVNPTPVVSNIFDTICSGSSYCVIPNSNELIVPPSTTYTWGAPISTPPNSVQTASGGSFAAVINSNPSICIGYGNFPIYNNLSPLAPAQMNFQVIPKTGTCLGDTFDVQLVVNPIPTVIASAVDPVLCPGEQTQLNAVGTPATDLSGNTGTYTWLNPILYQGSNLGSTVTTVPLASTTSYTVQYNLAGCIGTDNVSVIVSPVPIITNIQVAEAVICEGGCDTLTANIQGAYDTVIWSAPIPFTVIDNNTITFCYNDTLNVEFFAQAQLGNCYSNLDSISINIIPDPLLLTQPVLDTTICVGGNYSFSVAVSGGAGGPNYQWYQVNPVTLDTLSLGGSNGANSSTYTPLPVFNTAGDYLYFCEITYTASGCNDTTSLTAEFHVLPDPIASINSFGADSVCVGGQLGCMTANVSGGFGSSVGYVWSLLTPPTFTQVYDTIPPDSIFCPPTDAPGNYLYTVSIIQSGNGCISANAPFETVSVVPDPVVTINGEIEVCDGAEVPLTTTVTGGIGNVTNYDWFQSQPVGSPFVPMPGWNAAGDTTVALFEDIEYQVTIEQSGNGCNAVDTHFINVVPDPIVVVDYDSLVCLNTPTELTASVIGGTGTPYFYWYQVDSLLTVGGSPVSDGSSSSITQTLYEAYWNFYYVALQMSGLGCDPDTSDLIIIKGLDWAVADFDVSPDTLEQSIYDPTFSFFNKSQNATEYWWNLGECNPQLPNYLLYQIPSQYYNPTATNIINYTYGCEPGIYTVQLIASNQGLCPDTAIQQIKIKDELVIYVPNTFTPDDDGLNDVFLPILTSFVDPDKYEFEIYDRWGERIFYTDEPEQGWDGKYYGDISQDGTYTWRIKYRHILAEENKLIHGHVNLIR